MKSIDISKDSQEYHILNTYLGQGRLDASLVFFGNEPGTSGSGVKDTIEYLKEAEKFNISNGYLIETTYSTPISSEFTRFISRLTLALKNKELRFLGELSQPGKVKINEHVCKPNVEKDICLVNLRPLPRPTQDTWDYPNINKKGYLKSFNYTLKRHSSDYIDCFRADALQKFFHRTDALIIGVGEKKNKRAFFEKQYPFVKFHTANLDHTTIYFNLKEKIILCDYFNTRNGVKLSGLTDIYNFIISRKLM